MRVPTIKMLASGVALLCLLVAASGCRQLGAYGSAPPPVDGPTLDLTRDGGEGVDAHTDSHALADGGTDEGTDTGLCFPFEVLLSGAEDDGEIYAGAFESEGETPPPPEVWGIYSGHWVGNGYTWAFFRFIFPQGLSNITGARLVLWGLKPTALWAPNTHALRVSLEAALHAPPVTKAGDAPDASSGRPIVATTQRWPESGGLAWAVDAYNPSPNLMPLLQTLDEDNGLGGVWPKGTALQFWLRGDFVDASAEVATPYFGAPGYHPAKLVLDLCP